MKKNATEKPDNTVAQQDAEHQAQRLKTRDQALGRADEASAEDLSGIGWQTDIDPANLPSDPANTGAGSGAGTAPAEGDAANGTDVASAGGASTHASTTAAAGAGTGMGSSAATANSATGAGTAPATGTGTTPVAGGAAAGLGAETAMASAGGTSTHASTTAAAGAGTGMGSSAATANSATGAGTAPATGTGTTPAAGGAAAGASQAASVPQPLALQGDISGTTFEDGVAIASGKLIATGGTPGAMHWLIGNSAGQYGTLAIDQDGTWHYSLDNASPAVQALQAGQEVSDKFMVVVTDSSGAARLAEVAVKVTGSNDAPVVTGLDVGRVSEDSVTQASGKLDVSDVDSGEAHFQAGDIVGQHGTLHLAADGSWTYDLDNAAAQKLGAGDTATDTLTVQSADGTPHQITVTLTGTNDTAAITGTAVGTVTEDTQQTFSGKLDVADVDSGDALVQAIPHGTGQHGEFAVAADGSWTYTLSPTDTAVQALRPGDTPLTDTITVTSKDGSATQTLTVSIQGSNDAPVLQAVTQRVDEDGATLHGQLVAHDVDSTDILVFGTTQAVPGFTLHADGSYDFDPSGPAWQHLAPGAQQIINIPVTVTDQAGARSTETLQITLTGTNDAPTLMVMPPMASFEGSPPMHGRLAGLDVDDHDTLTYRATAPVAGFTLNADGSYTFDPADPAYEHLGFQQHQIINIPVEVLDSAGATASRTIQLTITGTNDAPTLNVLPPRNVAEGGAAVSGQLTATDTDDGATLSYSLGQTVPGFTLHADGSYSFDPADPHYNAIPAGQKAILTVPVIVTDEHGGHSNGQIQITVTGTNDVPMVAGIDHAVGSITGAQGHTLSMSGSLAVIDLDQGESHFQAQLLKGSYGVLQIGEDGHWSYAADTTQAALNQLPANGHVDEHFTVMTADGTTHSIDLQLKGSNAPAIFAGTSSGMVQEDQSGVIRHHLDVMDPNAGEAAVQPLDQATHYGHFTIAANGDWSYQLDNANPDVQALIAGKTLTDSILVGSVDGTPKMITVTILGTNDVAVISGTHAGDVVEDVVGTGTTLTADGQLTVADPDASQDHFIAMQGIPGDHGYGTFNIDAQGHWTYTADNSLPAIQALKDGATATDSFTVMTADGTKQIVTVTLTGTNDVAVISGDFTGDVTEDATHLESGISHTNKAQGVLHLSDVDTGEAQFTFQRGSSANGYGTFVLLPDGRWSYLPKYEHPDFQALGEGKTLTDSFTVHSPDGTQQTITITLHGTNDQPTISSALSVQGSEDHDIAVAVTDFGFRDVDARDALHHVTLTQLPDAAAQGQFLLNGQAVAAGQQIDAADIPHLVFRPAANFNGDVTFAYNVSDGHVDSDETIGTLHVAGVNDAPVIAASSRTTGTVTEDAAVTSATGRLTATDADAGAKLSWSVAQPAGTYGSLAINAATGQWTYTLDNSRAATQALKSNQPGSETFTVTVTDEHGATAPQSVTIRVAGTNDGAVITETSTPTGVTEDSAVVTGTLHGQTYHTLMCTGQLAVTDVDQGEAGFPAQHGQTSLGFGNFALLPNGQWTYTADNDNPAIQSLPAGQHLTDTFQVHSADGTTHTVTVTLTGTNDAAVITGTDTGSVTEDTAISIAGAITTSGKLLVADVDTGEAHFTFQDQVRGSGGYGEFMITPSGAWIYSADASNPAIQALRAGETRTDTCTVTSTDGTAHTITVTLTGTNDAPVVTATAGHEAALGSTIEDTARTFTEADLLHLVGATDTDTGDALHVSAVTIDPQYGSFAKLQNGDWRFTPAANAHHSDIPLTISVSDGHVATSAQAQLSITSVTDVASPTMIITADQQVIALGATGTGAVVQSDTMHTGGPMHGLTIDLTILGGQQVQTQGIHGATLISYGTPSDPNHLYIWKPEDLTFRVGGQEYTTGVPLRMDGRDHRYTFVWNSDHGTLDVLVDGHLEAHRTGVGQGATIGDGGKFVLGQDQDSFGGGFQTNDAYKGTFFDVAIAKEAVDPQQLAGTPLRDLLQGSPNLLTHMQAQGSGIVDTTGHYHYSVQGDFHVNTVQVDTAVAPPRPGTTLHLQITPGAPADHDDTVVATRLSGFSPGTVVTDGTSGHSATVSGPGQVVDVSGWQMSSLSARLPPGSNANMNLQLEVVTRGPDGSEAQAHAAVPVVLDPTQPVPDAVIHGDDTKTTDEDSAVSGILTITDADASQQHFTAQTDTDGQYGKFSIGTNGHWTYTPDDRADALAAGATQKDSFTVTSADGTAHQLVISLTGTNDAPTITALTGHEAALGATLEDTTKTFTETDLLRMVGAADVDSGQTLHISAVSIDPAVGSFVKQTTGDWTFTPAANFNGAHLPVTLTVTDGTATTAAHGTLDVTAVNDAPTATAQTQTVTEDGAVLHGHFTATDAEGDTLSYSIATPVDGFTLNADGSYSFDPAHASYQHLAAGQTQPIDIPITVSDGHGGTITQNLQITLTGTDDAPIIGGSTASSGAAASSAQEVSSGNTLEQMGLALQNDPKLTGIGFDLLWAIGSPLQNGYDPVDNSMNDMFGSMELPDLRNLWVHSNCDILLTGPAGTQPQILHRHSDFVGTISPAQLGTLIDWVKQGADYSMAFLRTTGDQGGFFYLANSYHVSGPLDPIIFKGHDLTGRSSGAMSLKLAIDDAHYHFVPRVTGPAPEVTSGDVTEDSATTVTGTLHAHDVDDHDSLTFTVDGGGHGRYGDFSVNPQTGEWTYTLNAGAQGLKSGDAPTEDFTILVTDSAGQTARQVMTMTVHGKNDISVIAGEQTGTATEDNPATASGTLTITDADTADTAAFVPHDATHPVQGTYGSLTLDAQGHWVYTLDASRPAVQALNTDTPVTDHLTVRGADGSTATIAIAITGSNDAPVLSQVGVLRATAADTPQTYRVDYLLEHTTDVDDKSGLHIQNLQADPAQGTVTMSADGRSFTFTPVAGFHGVADLHYDLVDAHGGIGQGEVRLGVGQSAGLITLNDRPTLGGAVQLAPAINDGTTILIRPAELIGTSTDPDGDPLRVPVAEMHVDHGTISGTDSLGNILYTPEPGYTGPVAFTYDVVDWDGFSPNMMGTSGSATLQLTPPNTAPTVTADASHVADLGTTAEDTAKTFSEADLLHLVGAADSDAGNVLHVGAVTVDPQYGSFTKDAATGDWTFTPAANFNGAHLPVTLTVTDGTATTAAHGTLDVTAVNDAPTATAQTQTVTEDGALLHGRFTATDAEGDTLSYSIATQVDGFTLNADGSYSFDPAHASYQHLAAGQTQPIDIPIIVSDGHGGTITQNLQITLTGTDDAPIIGGSTAGSSAAPSGAQEISSGNTLEQLGLALQHDSKSEGDGNNLLWAIGSPLQAGYDPVDNSFNDFLLGSNIADLRTLKVCSNFDVVLLGPAGTQPQTLRGSAGTYGHDAGDATLGTLIDWVKQGADYSVQFVRQPGTTGSFYLFNPAVGASSPQLALDDAHYHFVPRITGPTPEVTSGDATEDTAATVTGTLHAHDVDDHDTLSFSVDGGGHGHYGDFSVNPQTGEWTYTLNAGAQGLKSGDVPTEDFTILVTDASGQTARQTMTMTVHGQDDVSVISGQQSGAATEDNPATASGTLTITDADTADTAAFVPHDATNPVQGTYGSLTLDAQGHWVYTLDASRPAVQALNTDTPATDHLTVHGADGSTATIAIAITGSNDAPVLSQVGVLRATAADTPQTYQVAHLLEYTSDVDDRTGLHIQNLHADPAQGTVTMSADGRSFTFTPAAGFHGVADLHYDLVDAHGGIGQGEAHLGVGQSAGSVTLDYRPTLGGAVQLAPAINDGTTILIKPSELIGTSTDADGDALRVMVNEMKVDHGTLHGTDSLGNILYTPEPGYTGPVAFTYDVVDWDGFSPNMMGTSGSATLQLTPPNTAPTVTADASHVADLGTTAEDTAKTFSEADLLHLVGAADSDAGNVLHVGAVTVDPQYGSFTKDAATGDWTFTPAANFNGNQVPLTISVTDGRDTTDAHAKLAVTAVDDALSIAADAAHPAPMPDIDVNTETTFTKAQLLQLVGAADPDGDALSISEIHIDPKAGYFAPQANGDWVFKPAANFHADDLDITLKVSDGTSTVEAHAQLDIKATPGQLAIATVDNALKAGSSYETASADLAIHGTAVGLPDGTPITVHLADKNHPENTFDLHTTVTGGAWSIAFDQNKVLVDGNHDWAVTARATDLFGTAVDATTEVVYQDTPTTAAQRGTATTSLDLLAGSVAGTVVQHVQYSTDGQHWSDQVPAGFTLAADGHTLQVDPTHAAYSTLGHSQQQQVQVRYELAQASDPSATIHQTASVTITGSNHGPTVSAVDAGHAGNLGATAEDTAKTYSEADLIRLVGGADADHDTLHVTAVHISPEAGSFARDASGSWTFTPAANYDGSHLPVTVDITDGTATATGHAQIAINPVADTPVLGISLGAVQLLTVAGPQAKEVTITNPGPSYGSTMHADFGFAMTGGGVRFRPTDPECADDLEAVIIAGRRCAVSGVEGGAAVLDVGPDKQVVGDLWNSGNSIIFVFKDDPAHSDPHHASTDWVPEVYSRPGEGGDPYVNGLTSWSDPQTIDRLAGSAPSDSHFTGHIPEDATVDVHITLSDPDSSEHLALMVSGLPQGATLSAGTHNADGTWSLTPAQLPGLTMTPPADFTGDIHMEVTATSTDHALTAQKVMQLDLTVDPVAETPIITSTDSPTVLEHSGAIPLDIKVDAHHDDGETLSVKIDHLPPGAVLSAGTHNADGSWTLTPAQLHGLTLTPRKDWSGPISLEVTATSTEATGETTTTVRHVTAEVRSVLDGGIVAQDVTVNANAHAGVLLGVPLGVHLINMGADSGEHISMIRLDLPSAAWAVQVPSVGVHDDFFRDDGSPVHWDRNNTQNTGPVHLYLTQQELSSVTISPPNGYTGDAQFNLHVIIGDEGARHTVDVPFAVHVQAPPAPAPQADAVDDTPIDTAATLVMDGGAEVAHAGEAFAVDVHPVIGTADPAQLDIRISLLPFGSVVSDGTHSETVSETNPGVNISGWNLDTVTVTPPADQADNFDFTLKSHPLDDPDAKWLSLDVPVVMAPGDGFPNADIGGEDRATTDEDSSVSGQLTISDADAGQDHFQAATIDGNYGSFTVDETGQWHYTPDDRADTLNTGEQANDHFAVESADGSVHQVVIGLTGTDDAPQLAAAHEVGVTEGNPPDTDETGGTAPAPDPALADYLQYADTSQEVGAGGTADGSSTAVDDYLAAAGVDPADVNGASTPDQPPTEVLVDDAAHGAATPDHETTTADDTLAAVPVDLLDPPHEDPQHHGV